MKVSNECKVNAVGKISEFRPIGPVFNPRPGRGLNFDNLLSPHRPWRGMLRIGLVSRRSKGGFRRIHVLAEKRMGSPGVVICHLDTTHSSWL